MNQHSTAGIAIAFLTSSLAACATQNETPEYDLVREIHVEHVAPAEEGVAVSGSRPVRRTAALAQAGLLFARSFRVDPLNRPVSNTMSLGSWMLKSAGGLLRRVAIDTARFPALETAPVPPVAGHAGMDLIAWEEQLDRISGTRATRGTIRFLVDGSEYFARMLDAVQSARRSVDIRTYIFDNDDFAVMVADALREKSKTAEVRVIVDGIGNLMALQTDPESMPHRHRVPLSMASYLQYDSNVRVRKRANPWLTGDHTKTTIVDHRIAFLGGMNIGREYRYEWHDLMMELHGPVVDQLQFDTDRAWSAASPLGDLANFFSFIRGPQRRADDIGYPLRLLYTRNFDSQIYRAKLGAIRRAKRYILIENSYFSDDIILFELAQARRRGVDVRVIVPDDGNHGSHDASNRVTINRMLKNGIRVFRYPGMNHVKAMIVDGWACVGTANFDKLSLEINKEVNVATSHPAAVAELLQKVFLPDLERSVEVLEPLETDLRDHVLERVTDEFL